MGNTLSIYPVGHVVRFSPRRQQPAITAAESSLQALKHQPLHQNRYMDRMAIELYGYYKTICKRTFNMTLDNEDKVNILNEQNLVWLLIAAILRLVHDWTEKDNKPRTMLDAVILTGMIIQHNWSVVSIIDGSYSQSRPIAARLQRAFKELKNVVTDYTVSLEKILVFFTCKGMKFELPTFDNVKQQMRKVLDIFRMKFKSDDIVLHMREDVLVTPEDFLCSILGFNALTAERIHDMDKGVRVHETDQYWLERTLYDNNNYNDNPDFDDCSVEALVRLGFTKSKAVNIYQWLLQNDYREQQSMSYWAERYLEDTFRYSILLNDVRRYPYQQEQDAWLTEEIGIEDDGDDDGIEETYPLKYMNVARTQIQNLEFNEARYPPPPEAGFRFFFHATDHKSATNIIENGILLGCGKEKQDFSHTKGFYLSHDISVAEDWAKKSRFAPQSAIIIYKVSKCLLETFELFDLSTDETAWKDVICFNRNGQNRKTYQLSKENKKVYKNADFVEGPACEKPKKALCPDFKPSGFSRTDISQTCILSEQMAERFGNVKNINSVLFF